MIDGKNEEERTIYSYHVLANILAITGWMFGWAEDDQIANKLLETTGVRTK